jgi:hypothetical protein
MRRNFVTMSAALAALFIGVSTVSAGPYHTKIIASTDQPLMLTIAENVFLQIRNFTQEGGATRGTVTVTIDNESANVLTASQIDETNLTVPPETINRIVIAGPATVTVNPVAGATLTITYRKLREGAPGPTPTATATPTVTPTPTPTQS